MINNINFLIDKVAFSIRGFDVAWYGLIIGMGIIIAVALGIREGEKLGMTEDDILNGAIPIVLLSILGARIYYCIFAYSFLSIFDLSVLLAIHDGGLAIHGGIIVAFVSAVIYCRIAKLDTFLLFDIMAPSFLIAQSIGRWGNFINKEAYGAEVSRDFLENTLSLPKFIVDQMNIYGTYHHPTFFYESLWNLIGFIIIMNIRRLKITYKGELFLGYIAWYGFGRFFVEATRTDSLMMFGIKTNQVSSALMFIVGVSLIVLNRVYKYKTDYYVDNLK